MTCDETRDRFSALVDEALTPNERAGLDRHLAGCAECRGELQRFRGVVSLVRAVEPERAPVGFVDSVLARTDSAPWSPRLVRWLPVGATAAVLLGVLVTLLYRQSPELEQAARREAAPPSAVVDAPAVGQAPAPPADLYTYTPAPASPQEVGPRARDARPSTPPASEPTAPMRNKRESGPEETARLIRGSRGDVAAREPDIVGRLAVADLAAAEKALASLIARSAGRETDRRPIQDSLELEVEIPRARAEEFARELADIGRWQAARAVESAGDLVRVRIQLVR